jgi:hypothetical protein
MHCRGLLERFATDCTDPAVTGSIPLLVIASVVGEDRNLINAGAACDSFPPTAILAENAVIFCASGASGRRCHTRHRLQLADLLKCDFIFAAFIRIVTALLLAMVNWPRQANRPE